MAEGGIDHGTFIPKTNVLPLHHSDDAERGYKHKHILKQKQNKKKSFNIM